MDFTKLQAFLDRMAATRSPGNAIVVYHGGKEVFRYAAGYADLETKTPMTGEEYVNIYSCSKVATVTAGAHLLERGAFLLSDPLYEYLPAFRHMSVRLPDGTLTEAKNPIRVGDLFSMTAGFHYDLGCPSITRLCEETDKTFDTVAFANAMAGEPLAFEPGTHWQYSLCHDVLGGLIAAVSGMPLAEYARKNLFEPLGITKLVYHHTPEVLESMASQYVFVADGENSTPETDAAKAYGKTEGGTFVNFGKGNRHALSPAFDSGGAGITTTAGEYAKFAAAMAQKGLGLNGERILSSATVDLMRTNRLNAACLADYNWPQVVGYGYGLGVRTHMDKAASGSLTSLGEFGWSGAAGATFLADPERNLGLCYVQHCLNPREEWYLPRLRNVVSACLDA
ncbi:MAG: beta-lactamase family protein [Clostridia bacterium]|nr:beta-lactamase family protein [Clostridia bacterium]